MRGKSESRTPTRPVRSDLLAMVLHESEFCAFVTRGDARIVEVLGSSPELACQPGELDDVLPPTLSESVRDALNRSLENACRVQARVRLVLEHGIVGDLSVRVLPIEEAAGALSPKSECEERLVLIRREDIRSAQVSSTDPIEAVDSGTAESVAASYARRIRELEELATHDPLTGLLNRRGLELRLSEELAHARRSGDPMSAILIDCDDFKRVNDSLGHATGDAVLAQIAGIIRARVRPRDHVGRFGGDEFLVLMPATRMPEALVGAQRLRVAIAESPVVTRGERFSVTASMSLVSVPTGTVGIEEVVGIAHSGLNESKRGGKNRVTATGIVSSPSDSDDDRAVVSVAQEIRDLETGAVTGFEFLSRLNAADTSLPEDFFTRAMREGSLTSLDIACLRTSVQHALRAQAARGAPVEEWVHFNLFPSTLLDVPSDKLLGVFAGLNLERTCIEVSQSYVVGSPEYLRPILRELRSAGLRIALDDVGLGRSSLEALIVLEPDVVKIDGEFAKSQRSERWRDDAFTRLLQVVASTGVTVIAEGIETRAELERLRSSEVGWGQGFLWGRPRVLAPA